MATSTDEIRYPALSSGPGRQGGGAYNHAGTDLKDLVTILNRRRRLFIAVIILITGLAAFLANNLTPHYSATSALVIEPRESRVVDIEAVLEGVPQDDEFLQTQVSLLSTVYARDVVDSLDLNEYPALNAENKLEKRIFDAVDWAHGQLVLWSPDGLLEMFGLGSPAEPDHGVEGECVLEPPEACDVFLEGAANADVAEPFEDIEDPRVKAAVRAFRDGLRVQRIEKTYMIRLSVSSTDPKFSSDAANKIAELYIDDQLNVKREATLRAARWLTDRVAILRAQAIKAEEEVQDYRAEHGLLQVTGTRFDAKELTGLQGELIGTQVELSEIEAKIEVVQSMRQQGAEAGSLAEVLVSPLVGELRRQLIALQRQQTQLLNDYGTRHPAVVNVRSEIEQLSADLRSELGTIAGALENQLRILRNREATIEDKIAAAKSQSLSIDEAETRLDELQRTAHVTRAQYDSFLKRLKEVNEQQDLLEPGARLALRATEPADASFPKPNLIIAAGFVSSLLLGALLAFVREYLDTTLRSGHQLEQAFGLPNWGYVPNVKGLKSTQRPHTYLVEKPRSGYAAGLEGLRVALELSDHENPPQAVLVTSSVPDEGKTSLAIGLSVIAARSGIKTIVVDLDLRRPSVHKELGLKVRHCLFDYMAGECSIDDAIYHGGSPYDFDALPLTKPPARSLDMLRDERMAELITALRQRYDYIVLDSAPVLGLSDTVVASRLADAAVFAVRWSKTEEGMVRNALNGFLRGRMSTVGTVLTRVNPARQKSYRYGDDIQYYGKFEKYYLN